jgi:basic membrane protein A and related proteins
MTLNDALRSIAPTRGLALAGLALVVAACGSPSPTPAPGATPTPTPTQRITAAPSPQLVATITFVAQVVEPAAASESGLAWAGIQATAKEIGATATLVQPVTAADLPAALKSAASAAKPVVVTFGPESHPAVLAAAVANPGAQFVELEVAVAGGPANVHGIVFDEAEAGYLAGFVAAGFSATGKVAFAGSIVTDDATANYAAGIRSGAALARANAAVTVGYAGAADAPDKGRTAAAALLKPGVDVLVAAADLTGIGAMREACEAGVKLVAIGTDAWQTVPDVRSCLIGSVVFRADTAATTALRELAAGRALPGATVADVASGGIALSDFHVDRPAGFDARLASVLATLRNNPPRATAAPPSALPSVSPAASK